MAEPPSSRPRQTLLERMSALLLRAPEDRDQLLQLLRQAHERELLDAEAVSMIEGVLQVADLSASDIMVPRAEMDVIDIALSPDAVVARAIATGHSRFPVIEGERDNVVGILLAKDLLRLFAAGGGGVRELLRQAVFIPESKRLNVLLRDFRLNRNHLAIVVDEFGDVAGLITIEDVLEQIVGDIEDEFDRSPDTPQIVAVDDGRIGPRWRVHARAGIDAVNRQLGTSLASEQHDTIGGLVLQAFGRVPRRGESITLEGLRVVVMRADARSVLQLLLERLPDGPAAL